jgi:GntR family transcriptional regulator/MocR family aminotransferase
VVPSSRVLARDLRISRSTIILAYEQLRIEGYLEGRMGAATRVSALVPDRALQAAPHWRGNATAEPSDARPSRRAERIAAIPRRALSIYGQAPRAFRTGVPAVDIFPVDTWGRLIARRWRRTSAKALAYGHPFGYPPLRQAIADYLATARGVRCSVEQVLVVNGSQQGLDLAARAVLDPGDAVWLEEPGYPGARGAFVAASAEIIPVPVDADGLVVSAGEKLAPDAKLAFVTPSRQLPLGATLSLPRRLELLAWAHSAKSWIFEDDYDSEFRYTGRPLAALQGIDRHGCVIYAGTFSKVTFPALRLGYLVVPPGLVDALLAARAFMDFTSPYLEQAVMCDFMVDGHFERHIRRMRAIYHERQELLVDLSRREFDGRLTVPPANGGMTLVGWLPRGTDDVAVAQLAAAANVDVMPMSWYATRTMAPGLLLGYAGVRERELREGAARLARVLGAGHLPQRSADS